MPNRQSSVITALLAPQCRDHAYSSGIISFSFTGVKNDKNKWEKEEEEDKTLSKTKQNSVAQQQQLNGEKHQI